MCVRDDMIVEREGDIGVPRAVVEAGTGDAALARVHKPDVPSSQMSAESLLRHKGDLHRCLQCVVGIRA